MQRWHCPCGTRNTALDWRCWKCGRDHPTVPPVAAPPVGPWERVSQGVLLVLKVAMGAALLVAALNLGPLGWFGIAVLFFLWRIACGVSAGR